MNTRQFYHVIVSQSELAGQLQLNHRRRVSCVLVCTNFSPNYVLCHQSVSSVVSIHVSV